MAQDIRGEDESEYLETLRKAKSPDEEKTMWRYFHVLEILRRKMKRAELFVVAKMMISQLPIEYRPFILLLLKHGTLGSSRLNIIVKLERYTEISPLLILDDFFSDQHSPSILEKAVKYLNLPNDGGVLEVVRFLASNAQNPEIIKEKMLTVDIFRDNYPAVIEAKNWKESRIRNFIESVCRHLEVPIPDEARFVFLRAKIEREMKEFNDGETEPADFYDICVQHTKNKDEEFQCCINYLANHSNTLCRFFSKTRGVPFTAKDGVSTSTPECATPYNRCLHELACGRNKFLNDGNAVAEFKECLKEPFFAAEMQIPQAAA